jgi:tetratricopeptide (TPR) repeat protein
VSAALIVSAAAGVAIASYRTGRAASEARIGPSALVWLGPSGRALEDAIDERIRGALAALDGPTQDARERVARYGSELRTARSLTQRAILANFADTRAIQRLAAVNWELGVLDGTLDGPGLAKLVAVGGLRAPRVPEVQAALGDVLYKLGRPDDAERYMARAVTLSPQVAFRVVRNMVEAGVDPARIVQSLPGAPEVLVALMPIYVSQGRSEELLSLVETRVAEHPSQLIAIYGDLALSLGRAEHLTSQLVAIGSLKDARDEAERQLQLGRASAERGAYETAYQFGVRALALWPADPRHCEFAASAARESGHFAEAETMLREGLSRLATIEGTSGWRARLNRALGEVYERRGQGDEALVYFRRALEHDPNESVAKAKVAQIDALLGGKAESHP